MTANPGSSSNPVNVFCRWRRSTVLKRTTQMKAFVDQGIATNWKNNTPHLPPGTLATATLNTTQGSDIKMWIVAKFQMKKTHLTQHLLFNFTALQVSSLSYLHFFHWSDCTRWNASRWGKFLQDDHMTLAYFLGRHSSWEAATADKRSKDEGHQPLCWQSPSLLLAPGASHLPCFKRFS